MADRIRNLLFLMNFFADVDAFCSEPELCDEDDIDADELKQRCVNYLGKLELFNPSR